LFVVQDIATGVAQGVVITEPGVPGLPTEIFWSADGETVVLTLINSACPPNQISSIVRINIEDMTATTLIAEDDRFFQIQEWPNPDQPEIRLTDQDGQSWWLEINSGELAESEG
jgi:hypothetical protein